MSTILKEWRLTTEDAELKIKNRLMHDMTGMDLKLYHEMM